MTGEQATFGAWLRCLRLAAGLTQEELAERSQLSERAIRDLERDRGRSPRLHTVRLLAEALNLEGEAQGRLLALARPESLSVKTSLAGQPSPRRFAPTIAARFLTPLIGRADDVWVVKGMLDDVRLVTVSGPGGVGKTRLVAEVVAQVADGFDRSVLVELAPLCDSTQVLRAIAASVSIRDEGPIALFDLVVGSLQAGRALLVLDNMEHLLARRDTVLDLLAACPNLRILITSREALRVRGERVYTLGPLPLPEPASDILRSPAVQLFLDRARDAGAEVGLDPETAEAVAELCRRLDGLPLAIELAAAWTPLLSPPALLSRLTARLPYLDRGPQDLPARQRTMRDTIAWSYYLLNAEERAIFRRLSLFGGGWTVEAASALCGEPGQETRVLMGLAALRSKNLILVQDVAGSGGEEPRLTMLETIREYGLAMLTQEGETGRIRDRYIAFYRAYVRTAAESMIGPDHASWQERLEREHDNLRAALRWALDADMLETAQELAEGLWKFWSLGGHLTEGRAWLRQILGRLPEKAAAGVMAAAAALALEQTDFDEARSLGEGAAALARRYEQDRALVLALRVLGEVAWRRDRYPEAREQYEAALRLARTIGDREGEMAALSSLAMEAGFTGDLVRAASIGDEAVTAARVLDDPHALATAFIGQSFRTAALGRHDQSATFAEEALNLFRSLGDTGKVAEALFALGTALNFQRQYERAAALLTECLTLRLARGDLHTANATRGALGIALLNLGDLEGAEGMLEASYRFYQERDVRLVEAISLATLAHLALARKHTTRARSMSVKSARLFVEIGNPVYLPWSLEALSGAAAQEEQWESMARLCGARDAILKSIGASGAPLCPDAYDAQLAAARAALDEAAFEAYRAEGRTMALKTVLRGAAASAEHHR